MARKVLGRATYTAYRLHGITHLVATGKTPNLFDKVDFEELPFRIYPPMYALYFISPDISIPTPRPFVYEERIIFPQTATSIRIQDADRVHDVRIADVAVHDLDVGPKPADASADYCVFSWIGTSALLVARCDAVLPAVYARVFGPASEATCQQYVIEHGAVGSSGNKQVRPLRETFRAWIDRMPMAGPKLIVIGEVEARTGGWQVRLSPAVPEGYNPRILILNLEATPPTGEAPAVITKIPIRYEEAPPRHDYTQVTIRHDGVEFTLGVGQTH